MKKVAEQFIAAVSRYRSIVIYIPGSPDPDAIASAHVIRIILNKHLVESDIIAEKRLSLPQNRTFVEMLGIPLIFDRKISEKKYEAYIVPDYQSNRLEGVDTSMPCAAHIDHHGRSDDVVRSDFSLVRTDAGSTSTLVALILKNLELDLSEKELVSAATALTFGIQTDTDKYEKITTLDIEALEFLSSYADGAILERISSVPLSPDTLLLYSRARENPVLYRDWAFFGVGYIDSGKRDSMAVVADRILKNSGYQVVAVFAIVENLRRGELYLDVSLRAVSSSVDLNRLIKRITPNGGGRKYKGAYQVRLDYFRNAPDRDKLWEVVATTTLESLRRSRDSVYLAGLGSLYDTLKNRVLSLVRRDGETG